MDKPPQAAAAATAKVDPPMTEEDERLREYQTNPNIPADAKAIALLLRSSGIINYDPKIINQLLDFMHRYVTDLLVDAEELRVHAGHPDKKMIDTDDIKLAITSKAAHAFIQPPPRQVMVEMARQRNSQPLPTPPEKDGCVFLPPEENRLTNPGYQMAPENRMDTTE